MKEIIKISRGDLVKLCTQLLVDGIEFGSGGKLETMGVKMAYIDLESQIDDIYIERAIKNITSELDDDTPDSRGFYLNTRN